jgi:hypothetical protein
VKPSQGRFSGRRTAATTLACIVAVAPLQGCLLTRVLETRAQLCDERPAQVSVATQAGRGLRVVFARPTLTEQDVVAIVGFEPSAIGEANGARQLRYEVRPVDRPHDAAAGLVAKLSFVRVGGESRLAEVEIPEKFNAILPPHLLDAAVQVTCKARLVIVPPSTTFDLGELDRAALPSRAVLRQLLGPPTTVDPGGRALAYRYCLVPCGPGRPSVAHLDFTFDTQGDLERAAASYFRYVATLDLLAPEPFAIVELR